jgi:hypothetical protein
MITDRQRRHAGLAGYLAAKRNLDVTACPYNPANGPDDRVRALVWIRAYRRQKDTPPSKQPQ